MVKGLYTAYTGMIMEQNRMDILSNNLANSATNGYKKEGCTAKSFEDQLALKIKDTSEYNIPKPLGYVNMGVKIGETYTDILTYPSGFGILYSEAAWICQYGCEDWGDLYRLESGKF